MSRSTLPICRRCGVHDNPAHRAGFLHAHFWTIKWMIETGYGNAAIVRAIGLNPNQGGARVRMRYIRARLAQLGISRNSTPVIYAPVSS
jgi:hypothetical protein